MNLDMSNLGANGSTEAAFAQRDHSLFEYVIKTNQEIFRKGNAYKFSENERRKKAESVDWMGFRNRYFCAIVKPQYETTGYEIDPSGEKKLKLSSNIQAQNIAVGESIRFTSTIFAGPEKLDLLKQYNFGFEQIRKYYRFTLFDAMGKLVYSMMHGLHKVVPNWGACIIFISLLIYLVTFPLTIKSMSSMKKMQSLQPKMATLREKYKDNPQKMQKEIMEMYREYKVNPMGGCLPMLLQMPIFIGLYQALWRDVDFNGANFLWIKDLAAPDRLFLFSFNLPFFGNEFNILPFIMAIVMFFQQRLTSANMPAAADPSQESMQKMMKWFMPIFLGVIFYKFPSGLTLYFTMFYALSILSYKWKTGNA
jgi:YidC/Oxa1 family membrane protein insertase